jgi:hypothetical protein
LLQKCKKLGLAKGRGWLLNFLGAPMIYNVKSLFIALDASLRWLNNGWMLIFVIPANHKWSIFVR